MEKGNTLPFPYEFEDLKAEEKEYLEKMYKFSDYPSELSRVGPKGYVLLKSYKKDAANIYNMPLRPTDVFVASYQRSGTTWTQELVWLLSNDLDYKTAAAIPLTERYPFLDLFMFAEINHLDALFKPTDTTIDLPKIEAVFEIFGQPATRILEAMPVSTPRFIKTHLPMSLLKPSLLDTAKMVYVARDPRDVVVSYYHHSKLFMIISRFEGTFKEFWNLFYKDLCIFCPIFEHVKEAWEKRNHPNMLFLFYEDLSKDLNASISRVADFLGKKITQEESVRLYEHLSFDNFKNNKSVNFEDMREIGLLAPTESFVRKGKTGGWRDYFDEEMTQQAEQWIADNLRNTDLRYPHMNN
ncbi:unnamed protein product [Arctia plantaginis]|uniref:Sulfotransferase domain-containing protein n=2 Tax=Arctia plantaginis TaxID=874455 RepID=A0A8S1B6M6_ARCPL|nr:unnamed protein product [Arctia plantaginis]